MDPPLATHSDAGLVINYQWEKTPLMIEEF
jgi:hypothetical protein